MRVFALILSTALFMTAVPMEAWAASIVYVPGSTLKVTNLGYMPGGILTAADGSIYVKNCDNSTSTHGQVYKYHSDGTLDLTFGTDGHTTLKTSNRGVGLSYAPDGNMITTLYDGYIYKFNPDTGAMLAQKKVSGTPYCSVTYEGYIYVITRSDDENKRILVLDDSLNTVSDTSLGVGEGGAIEVHNGYYGLAIASTENKEGEKVERLYTTAFGSYVYGYIKSGNTWVKDASFGDNGSLRCCNSSAGGLFYNEGDQKVYVCSESDSKIYNFNPDGSDLNTVLQGAGPNNVYISDTSYAVPFFSGSSFQVFYRPSMELSKDNFSMELLNSVNAGTQDPLKLRVKNSNTSTSRSYSVKAQLLDEDGVPVPANSTTQTLVSGKADLTITPKGKWMAGQYQIQLLISSKIGGTSLTISETMVLNTQIPIGLHEVSFQIPTNGILENNDKMYAKETPAGEVGSSVTKWVQPAADYEVDVENSLILPEGSGAQVTVGALQAHTVNGVTGQWYPVTVSNITKDIQVTIAFKMNAAALQAKKQEALKALETAFQGYQAENYFGDNWGKLVKVKTDYASKIQNASSALEVDMALAGAQEEMGKIPDKTRDAERQKLVKDAVAAVEAEFDAKYGAPGIKDNYSEENWGRIESAKADAIEAINKAVDENGIRAAQEKGISDMAEVPTKAEEILNTKKEEVKAALTGVPATETDYTLEQVADIEAKRQELMNKAENASSEQELTGITDEFNTFVGQYLTNGERADLVNAVNAEFNRLKGANSYTDANLSALTGKKDIGVAAIQQALLKSEGEQAKDSAIADMGTVTTKAEQQKATYDDVKKVFDDAMKNYVETQYDSENWGIIEQRYNQALTDMQTKETESDMVAVMNQALGDIQKVETKDAALKSAKDNGLSQLATLYKEITDRSDTYAKENLDSAYNIYADAIKKVNDAASKEMIAPVIAQATTDFGGIKPISITLSVTGADFGTHPYAYEPISGQSIVISASMGGCKAVSVTGVALSGPNADAFTLEGPASGTLASGQKNKDWKISPASNLVPGTYTASLTVSYDCEGKVPGTGQSAITMTVSLADQETPENLSVDHQTQAGVNDGKIRGVTAGMEYKAQDASDYTPVPQDTEGTIENLAPGAYLVRRAAKEYYNPSSDAQLVIKEVQTNEITLTPAPQTSLEAPDGSITVDNPVGELEYRKDTGGYISCGNSAGDSYTISGLTAGTYYVRYKETDTALAGKPAKAEVKCDVYAFSCTNTGLLGSITLEGGAALPSEINHSGLTLKVAPKEGYEVKANGISLTNAVSSRGEEQADKSFSLTITDPKGEVTLSVNFTKTAEQEALDQKKESVVGDIKKAIEKELAGYTPDLQTSKKEGLDGLKDQAVAAVKDASTTEGVTQAYEDFEASLKQFHDKVLKDFKDEFTGAASPSDAIMKDRNQEDYSENAWQKLLDLAKKAENLVKDALTPNDIVDGMKKLELEAANVPTRDEESGAALKKAKEEALEKLATPSDAVAPNTEGDYTPEAWKDILNLISAAKAAINDAGTKTAEAVQVIMDHLDGDLGQVLTADGERAKYMEKLNEAYSEYHSGDYADEVWNILEGYYNLGTAKLENAGTRTEMEAILKDAKEKMSQVKNQEDWDPGALKDPNVELVEYLIDELPSKNATGEELEAARDAIAAAKDQYDSLTEKQAQQLDQSKVEKLEHLIKGLKNMELTIQDYDNLNVKADDMAGLVLDAMEIENASSAEAVLSVSLKDEDAGERNLVKEAIPPSQRIGSYLDITLEKIVDGTHTYVSQLQRPMEIRFNIPDNMLGHTNYQVVRIHDDKAEAIDTKQQGRTLTIKTNLFSTYAITYQDEAGTIPHSGGSGGGSGGGGGGGGRKFTSGASGNSNGPKSEDGTWIQNETGWWFSRTDGTWPQSQWAFINQQWYYFNQAGYMDTGWILLDNKWYYLKATGEMATGWMLVNGKWYYLNQNGEMATGWILLDGKWYYLGADGAMYQNQCIDYNQAKYYLGPDGAMAVDTVINGYTVDKDGKVI